jgi:antitoxin (DNA-binding transcriptional repressor) of toxin-antitoxin stability system
VKTVELADANAPLSEYAREATKQTLVVTRKGKPILALVRLPPDTDLENLAVKTHPTFQAIVQRAEARYQAEGGQVRRRLVVRRAARRKR